MEWIDSVLVPLGVLMLSTLFTLHLARLNRRDARSARTFDREERFADELIEHFARYSPLYIVGKPSEEISAWLDDLYRSVRRFERSVTAGEVPTHRLLQIYNYAFTRFVVATQMGATPTNYDKGARDLLDGSFAEATELVRDWVFPERREKVTRSLYALQRHGDPFDYVLPVSLLDRDWLTLDLPRGGIVRQRMRRTFIWLQSAGWAIVRGRWRAWRASRQRLAEQASSRDWSRSLGRTYVREIKMGFIDISVDPEDPSAIRVDELRDDD